MLSRILDKNNINYVFFKRSANDSRKYYNCIGERMIGDIDFLIKISGYLNLRKL